jgi:hypothetical protein
MNVFEATVTASKPRVLRAALVLGLLVALLGLGAQVATQARRPAFEAAPAQPHQIGPSGGACPDCKLV